MISSTQGDDELDPLYIECDCRDGSNGFGWLLTIDLSFVSNGCPMFTWPSGTCNGTINKPTGYNADTIGGGVVDCWKALLQLKPCTKEFRKFFSNGYVGPHCCRAVGSITSKILACHNDHFTRLRT
ncbi:hypothetical protein WN944_023380 [Citrus x changshan-huyou]|uniref:Prolamin-like domain-containing protein n=1 Tax=Citrus x changshan-huyou TaxID=2935761 RepID=A0AAP0QWX6_9ROSI